MERKQTITVKTLNKVHKIFWLTLSAILAICALKYNPGHLFTAAVLAFVAFVFKWEKRDE